MATGRLRGVQQQELDIGQIIREAQLRWLRPLEVIEILRNYQKYNFKLNPVPPDRPPSGALYLFDRKALRYFRKDGHQWRKKKDGKTVREAHERLKSGSVDVLHCYYAHGEQNPNFQRRSYWMLEGAYEHIVLVHYLEVSQGHRATPYQPVEQSSPLPSEIMSPENGSALEQEEADSGDDVEEIPPPVAKAEPSTVQPSLLHQISAKDWSSILSSVNEGATADSSMIEDDIDLQELLENPDKTLGQKSLSPAVTVDASGWQGLLQDFQKTPKQEENPWQAILEQFSTPRNTSPMKLEGQGFKALDNGVQPPTPPVGISQAFSPKVLGRQPQTFLEAQLRAATEENALRSAQQYGAGRRMQETFKSPLPNNTVDVGRASPQSSESRNQPNSNSLQSNGVLSEARGDGRLTKMDSFDQWAIQEIGADSPGSLLKARSESGSYWLDDDYSAAESSLQMDVRVTISPVQKFSIVDFSPDFAFVNEETKVLVTGRFLETVGNPLDCRWCCMFGDMEVPAEVINVGVLRCKVPPRAPGRVPFYVTCSDRLACSEVREFDIRPRQELASKLLEAKGRSEKEMLLQVRLARLLLMSDAAESTVGCGHHVEEWRTLEEAVKLHTLEQMDVKEKLLELFFRHKLQEWLSSRSAEQASVRDEHGQGVLHMIAALGYDWAVKTVVEAGVLPDFRDQRGWAALHWAALFGREEAVIMLLSLGATPGSVTDPTAAHPSGQMPSEMAAASGHKGMAGFLAEKALTSILSSLTIAEKNELSSMSASLAGENAVLEDYEVQRGQGADRVSLQRSLSAVRNATKAAALIHSAYRQDSFRKRSTQLDEEAMDEYGMEPDDIQAIMMHRKSSKAQSAAALQIQKKFRGWKGRRDFLTLKKHVVRIQAHVRGHQVRKKYKFLSVVGVVEKAVLRWRRKGVGLRGFNGAVNNPSGSKGDAGDDNDDDSFLREGRRQKEQALEKAVTRVHSMARSEEGREQYHRLLQGERAAGSGSIASKLKEEDEDEMMS